jgi:hypothetical protein
MLRQPEAVITIPTIAAKHPLANTRLCRSIDFTSSFLGARHPPASRRK